jgi:hypothetical protein
LPHADERTAAADLALPGGGYVARPLEEGGEEQGGGDAAQGAAAKGTVVRLGVHPLAGPTALVRVATPEASAVGKPVRWESTSVRHAMLALELPRLEAAYAARLLPPPAASAPHALHRRMDLLVHESMARAVNAVRVHPKARALRLSVVTSERKRRPQSGDELHALDGLHWELMRDLGRPFEREHAEAGATKVFPCADDVARAARWCVGGLRGTTDLPMSQVVALGRLLEAEVRAAYGALDRDEATPAAPLRFLCHRLAVDAAGHPWVSAEARASLAAVARELADGAYGVGAQDFRVDEFAARLASAWGRSDEQLAAVAREATEAQLADLMDTCAHEEGVWREAAEARARQAARKRKRPAEGAPVPPSAALRWRPCDLSADPIARKRRELLFCARAAPEGAMADVVAHARGLGAIDADGAVDVDALDEQALLDLCARARLSARVRAEPHRSRVVPSPSPR